MTLQAYTLSQVAEMLQSSQSSILREIQHGRLTAFRVGTRWRITDAALQAYVEAQTWHPENARKPEARRVTATSPGTPRANATAPLSGTAQDALIASIFENKPMPKRGGGSD